MTDAAFDAWMGEVQARMEAVLARVMPAAHIAPARLHEAMRYAALGGGKRVRPLLTFAAGEVTRAEHDRLEIAAAAVELIHAYSLAHDDLPCMDNDVLRRGKPTVHKAFDDATAILAGDALLTFAFDVLARPAVHPDAAVRIELVARLARAAGLGGMVGGQMLDLAAEGRFAAGPLRLAETEIANLQWMKTGALIRFACVAGGVLGKASRDELDALSQYGIALGRAFQIADDLLDVEGSAATVGKSTGKDAAAGKATLVGLLGTAGARVRLKELVDTADRALASLRGDTAVLKAAARFVSERQA